MTQSRSTERRIIDATDARPSLMLRNDLCSFSVRISPQDAKQFHTITGLEFPNFVGETTTSNRSALLCLGPDEWLVTVEAQAKRSLLNALERIPASIEFSLVDVTDRNLWATLKCSHAEAILMTGCPVDLSDLDRGAVKRTVMWGVEVILLKNDADDYSISVWRSFYPHVQLHVEKAISELSYFS